MSDDNIFYLPAILIIIAFTLWIGWYTIIPVIIIAFCFSIYHYIDSKNKAKTMKEKGIYYNRMTVGEVILSSVIISVVGLIFIAVCMLFKSCVNDDGPGPDRRVYGMEFHDKHGHDGLVNHTGRAGVYRSRSDSYGHFLPPSLSSDVS